MPELGLHDATTRDDPLADNRRQDDKLKGWLNATGEFTIASATGITTVSDDRVTPDSSISFQPTEAEGQAMLPKIFVQILRPGWAGKTAGGTTVGDFVLEHPIFTRSYTYRYTIIG